MLIRGRIKIGNNGTIIDETANRPREAGVPPDSERDAAGRGTAQYNPIAPNRSSLHIKQYFRLYKRGFEIGAPYPKVTQDKSIAISCESR